MKRLYMTLAFSLLLFTGINSQNPSCGNCTNTMNGCLNSRGGATITDTSSEIYRVIVVRAARMAQGCVIAYNNCITNNNCYTYPFAVFQEQTNRVKITKSSNTKRR